jgi:purine-nucleoside/S-methyl-5'-thioadenosine phosphorylase / adenosine deaminase
MTTVRLLHWPEAAAMGATVAVTTRHGGSSQGVYDSLNLGLHVGDDAALVLVNRGRAAAAFGVGLDTLVFAEQVHGVADALVGVSDRGRGTLDQRDCVPSTDILVTTTSDTTLVMLVADCVPLALIDPDARVLAVVHAGWRGTSAGAVARALEAMARQGARPDRVMAYMGPAVEPARYQVDQAVHHALSSAVAPRVLHPDVAQPDGPGHWKVDLIAANRQQLLLAGVPRAQIYCSGVSTGDGDLFSDRTSRPCGRFALMARLHS